MIKLGVLTYDIQPFCERLLFRLQSAMADISLTAYPCFHNSYQYQARIPVSFSNVIPKPFGVSGLVKEAFTLTLNMSNAIKLVWGKRCNFAIWLARIDSYFGCYYGKA
jgi:hypothetical protein